MKWVGSIDPPKLSCATRNGDCGESVTLLSRERHDTGSETTGRLVEGLGHLDVALEELQFKREELNGPERVTD